MQIYCANCLHCKLLIAKVYTGETKLRTRCSRGNWGITKGFEDRHYRYDTILNRRMTECAEYHSMSDCDTGQEGKRELISYIHDLKKSLPTTDEIFVPMQRTL